MSKRRFSLVLSVFLALSLALGALAAPAAPSITIARLSGTVEVSHIKQTQGKWQAAKQGQSIGLGWKLRTGKDGKVQLTFPKNNTVILKSNSVLYVDKLDDGGGGRVMTDKGGLLVQLKNALSSGSTFQVDTPAALATVRGTEFGVDIPAEQAGGMADAKDNLKQGGQLQSQQNWLGGLGTGDLAVRQIATADGPRYQVADKKGRVSGAADQGKEQEEGFGHDRDQAARGGNTSTIGNVHLQFELREIGDLDGDDAPDLKVIFMSGPAEARSLTSNSLSTNDLSTNGLSGNALSSNGLPTNGLPTNGVPDNGIAPNKYGAQATIVLEADLDGDGVPEKLSAVAVGDVNGDGWTDFAVASKDNGGVKALDGNPILRKTGDTVPGQGDVDGDGSLDPVSLVAVGDLNGDGVADFVVAGNEQTEKKVPISGTTVIENPSKGRTYGRVAQGDGKPHPRDVVVTNGPMLQMDADGDGIIDPLDNDSDNDGIDDFAVGDLNGDGILEHAFLHDDVDGDGRPDWVVLTGFSNGDIPEQERKASHDIAMNAIRNIRARTAGGGGEEQGSGNEGSADVIGGVSQNGPKVPGSHGNEPGTGTPLPTLDGVPKPPPPVLGRAAGGGQDQPPVGSIFDDGTFEVVKLATFLGVKRATCWR